MGDIDWSAFHLMPRLLVAIVRQAAASFKKSTAAGDGWTPRQKSFLSDGALGALTGLFAMFEQAGNFDSGARDMRTALLSKPSGGFRPIGVFRSMFRVWSRARQSLVRAWALQRVPAVFNVLPGRATVDTIWRSQVRRTGGLTQYAAELNWDVKKCFESVRRRDLVHAALRHGYPAGVLRLSVQSYGWARRMVWRGVVS